MRDETISKLLYGATVAIMVVLGVIMSIFIWSFVCEKVWGEEIETLVNEYPFWAVSASGDSTFQTVQIIGCREIFPNGQRKLLGYKVAVDSAGCRIYEEKSVWFLTWAVHRALRLRDSLGKQ